MEPEVERPRPDTFVIHVAPGDGFALVGFVHHVRTGEKRRFDGLESLGAAIHGMARREPHTAS